MSDRRLSAERWQQLEPLLDAALALAPGQREVFLREACGSDTEMYRELNEMLEECDREAARLAGGNPASERVALEVLRAALADRYDIHEALGHGGMATVYRATDRKHWREVAIKTLRPDLAATIGAERFLREIGIVARLSHPNVLPLHDSGAASGILYYVTPLVDEGSLRDRLHSRAPLDVMQAVQITLDICAALDFAHRHGVVHRDVKPENVLLRDGRALVADFGIAASAGSMRASSLTPVSTSLGTPAYMSPEQATGVANVDGRADVYGTACVLYEMLTGTAPYRGPSSAAIMAQHVTSPVPSPRAANPRVPPALDLAVQRALAKDRAQRTPSAAAFAAELRASVPGGGDAQRPAPTPPPVSARSPRRRSLLIAAAMGVLMLVAAIGVWARLPGQKRAVGITMLTRGTSAHSARRIVVAPFENRTGDSTLAPFGDLAADWLARELQDNNFDVVDGRSAAMAMRVVDRLPSILRSSDRATALADETAAGILITGRFYKEGDSLLVQATATQLEPPRGLAQVGPVGVPSGNQANRALKAIAARTTAALAAAIDSSAGAPTTALTEPPSMEAFRHASLGWETFFAHPGDTAIAFAELARAIAIDTDYAAPRLMRAYMLDVHERWPDLAAEVRAIAPRRATLGRAERWALEMFEADLRGDGLGRLRAARELARLSGGATDTQLLVAVSAGYVYRHAEAIAALDRADPDRGINLVTPMYWAYRAKSEHLLGRFDDEWRTVQECARRFPDALDSFEGLARAAATRGHTREVDEILARARTRLDKDALGEVTLRTARELRIHGRAEAGAHVAAALTGAGTSLPVRAVARYESAQWDSAWTLFAALARAVPDDVQVLGPIGVAAAHRGELARADSVDRQLRAWHRPFTLGTTTVWRARIAAARGDHATALALYRDALRGGWRASELGTVGLHEDAELAAMRNEPAARELLTPRSGALSMP